MMGFESGFMKGGPLLVGSYGSIPPGEAYYPCQGEGDRAFKIMCRNPPVDLSLGLGVRVVKGTRTWGASNWVSPAGRVIIVKPPDLASCKKY
jgi:hypothetical protein